MRSTLKQLGPARAVLGLTGALAFLAVPVTAIIQQGFSWTQWWLLTFGLAAIALALVSRVSRPVLAVYGVMGLAVFVVWFLADLLVSAAGPAWAGSSGRG